MGCTMSTDRHHIAICPVEAEKQRRKPQPSPPPPSILRELFNDIAANVAEAVDSEGKATAKGLVALIQEVATISGVPCEQLPKPSQIDDVMTHLDVNKNGTIEFGEFLHWISLQCGMSTNARNKKRKKNDLQDRLQNLVDAIRQACKILLTEKRAIEAKLIPLENGLNIMFRKYDADGSGYLDVDEIAQLLVDTAPVSTMNDGKDHSNDANEILYALDGDHNGMVEEAEFIKWVMSGLSRPKRSREIFASYSGFHNRMENMLVGIENTAMKDVAGYDEQLGYMESKEDQGRDVEVVEEGAPGSLFR